MILKIELKIELCQKIIKKLILLAYNTLYLHKMNKEEEEHNKTLFSNY